MKNIFRRRTASNSADLERILKLKQSTFTEEDLEEMSVEYTEVLKQPGGTWKLKPVQAHALHVIANTGGLVAPMPVGAGKTLVSLLATFVCQAERPLLLLPAFLIQKTEVEKRLYSKHFRIPSRLKLHSYESLGRVNDAYFLDSYKPDLIIADEAHKLKNTKAGVTRRIVRYLKENPKCRFVVLSGTLMKDSIRDFAHLSALALAEKSPAPLDHVVIEEWANAMESNTKNPLQETNPGPLLALATQEDIRKYGERSAVRLGFQKRFLASEGVVASYKEEMLSSLYITSVHYDVNEATERNFSTLRDLWETPDGWALEMATDVARHAYELSLGFHYVWDPRPPENWLNARREWASFVREILSKSKTLDTPHAVALACLNGDLDARALKNWLAVRDTFRANQKALWHDTSALDYCKKWGTKEPGIIWVRHGFFGRALEKMSGFEYFGAKGVNSKNVPIEFASGENTIIASIKANGTGRNLQNFNRNLFTSWQTSAPEAEQTIGRTHRSGQKKDEVFVDFLLTCAEHLNAFQRCLEDAKTIQETTGHKQKILQASVILNENHIQKKRSRWCK